MNTDLIVAFLFLLVLALLAIDDLFIDAVAWIKNLRPRPVHQDELRHWRRMPQKNIAVLVANWREEQIIERMLRGNLSRVEYARLWFFVGVYPNDKATVQAAQRAARSDDRVIVIENSRMGPTTKGQMLNVIFERIFDFETRLSVKFDLFLLHDSEDILHPQSLLLLNAESRDVEGPIDFMQIPVFSLPRKASQIIGSTYIDEFAEIHTKDLLVRDALNAGVPSAGVGTAVSRRLVLSLMNLQGGRVLNEASLTEDYVLGLTASWLKYRSKFIARYIPQVGGGRGFIATREYFPNEWGKAVRQKGRWVHGIVIQGSKILPLEGSLARRYFLLRDRKGPVAAFMGLLGLATLVGLFAARMIVPGSFDFYFHDVLLNPVIQVLCAFNLSTGIFRAINRAYAVWRTQDLKTALVSFLRIPVGNLLNFAAVVRAVSEERKSRAEGRQPTWTKTTHELPANFGLPASSELSMIEAHDGEAILNSAAVAAPVAAVAENAREAQR